MRPKDLSKFLAHAIAARKPILIVGAPGVGKTDLTRQAAEAVGADFVVTHPVVEDPTNAMGLPWPSKDNGHANFLPFGQLAKLLKAERPAVWLMDDLGQSSPAVQAANMQWILARQCGEHKLPGWVTIIAATNRRTDRAGVSGILEPVKSRFASIVELEANLDDWGDWYISTGGPVELLAFLRFRPNLLHDFAPTADLTNSPSPRTWVNAASFINAGLPPDIELAAISGAVGKGAAAEFVAFLRVYRDLPSLEGIILDPMGSMIPPAKNPSARYALVTGLASKANVQTLPNILKYAERLLKEAEAGEFAALLLRDIHRRDNTLARTHDWVKMTFGPIGHLISGTDFEEPAEPKAAARKGRK